MTVAPITEADANSMGTVADVMVRHPKLCHEDSTVGDVRQLFADDHVHAVLIMSGTRLLTVLDRADLGPEAADSAPAARLGRLSGRVTTPTASAESALQQMIAASRRRLAVVGPDGTLLGLLCLKRSGTAFCSDENVHQRQREHLQQHHRLSALKGRFIRLSAVSAGYAWAGWLLAVAHAARATPATSVRTTGRITRAG